MAQLDEQHYFVPCSMLYAMNVVLPPLAYSIIHILYSSAVLLCILHYVRKFQPLAAQQYTYDDYIYIICAELSQTVCCITLDLFADSLVIMHTGEKQTERKERGRRARAFRL